MLPEKRKRQLSQDQSSKSPSYSGVTWNSRQHNGAISQISQLERPPRLLSSYHHQPRRPYEREIANSYEFNSGEDRSHQGAHRLPGVNALFGPGFPADSTLPHVAPRSLEQDPVHYRPPPPHTSRPSSTHPIVSSASLSPHLYQSRHELPALDTALRAASRDNTSSAPSAYPRASSTLPQPQAGMRAEVDHQRTSSGQSDTVISDTSEPSALYEKNGGLERFATSGIIHKPVGVEHTPGEGRCYVLQDGTRVKTIINGEAVNPVWGVTKAGKPRKRLAQACVACREKKIKCEPGNDGSSRCNHCARLNRECKKTKDPRQSPESPVNGITFERSMGGDSNGVVEIKPENIYRPIQQPRAAPETADLLSRPVNHTVDTQNPYFQKVRQAQDSTLDRVPSVAQTSDTSHQPFHSSVDPYAIDPELTLKLLELYFYHRGRGPYTMLPKGVFLTWVQNCTTKSLDDRMILYALMALGSRFSKDPKTKILGEQMAAAAKDAVASRDESNHTLQLAQTRLDISLYHFARGDFETTYEWGATAIRTVKRLKYSSENGVKTIIPGSEGAYGMSETQLIECRRRTFWIIYLLDVRLFHLFLFALMLIISQRYNSFNFGCMGIIHDLEIHLRFPTHESTYEAGLESDMAHFHGDSIREPHIGEPGAVAMITDIASIWGDVTGHAYRALHRSKVIYAQYFFKYFEQVRNRLSEWEASLPPHFQYSPANTVRALQQGNFGTYFVIHSIHCVVAMKHGRLGRYELLSDEVIRRAITRSVFYARRLLTMATTLSAYVHKEHSDDIEFALAQPFPGYCILSACDIISAGGSASGLKSLTGKELQDAKTVCHQIGRHWASANKQFRAIEDRQAELSAYAMSGNHYERLRMPDAMEKSFLPENHDMIYSASDAIFYSAFADAHTDIAP